MKKKENEPKLSEKEIEERNQKENEILSLIETYKHLVNFQDNMEKNNFKFMEQYIKRQRRLNPHYLEDCISFLTDLIDVHKGYLQKRGIHIQDANA